jgi:hypothetical protein
MNANQQIKATRDRIAAKYGNGRAGSAWGYMHQDHQDAAICREVLFSVLGLARGDSGPVTVDPADVRAMLQGVRAEMGLNADDEPASDTPVQDGPYVGSTRDAIATHEGRAAADAILAGITAAALDAAILSVVNGKTPPDFAFKLEHLTERVIADLKIEVSWDLLQGLKRRVTSACQRLWSVDKIEIVRNGSKPVRYRAKVAAA